MSYIFMFSAAAATAAIVLAKFSAMPVALVAFGAIDVWLALKQRLPLCMASFLISLLVWFTILQSDLLVIFEFIRFSLNISAGYSEAMSTYGDAREVCVFLALFIMLILLVLKAARARDKKTESVWRWWLIVSVLVVLCFTGFKIGFVRHDLHSRFAWDTLALAAVSVTPFMAVGVLRWLSMGLSVVAAGVMTALPLSNWPLAAMNTVSGQIEKSRVGLVDAVNFALRPKAWIVGQKAAMQRAVARTRVEWPLPSLDGSVDTLPSIQGAVIAAGLNYKARFTIQDYVAYTRELIEENRKSWFGPSGPKYILFGLMPIDGRYPALSEGPLWPELLRYYEPERLLSTPELDLVLLVRRGKPLPEILGPATTHHVRLNERFVIGKGPTFLQLDIQRGALGRLATVVFKPPLVRLRIEYENGQTADYRIIPEIARCGFIVSPEIRSAQDYDNFARGELFKFSRAARPVAAWVRVGNGGMFAYHDYVTITFRYIDISILQTRGQKGWPNLPFGVW